MLRHPHRNGRQARRSQARRLNLEMLEFRELLTAFTVTSAADNGDNTNPIAGSLRAEILAADNDTSTGSDTISFNIPGGGVQTISLDASLPAITRTVVIDGTSQPGYTNAPEIVLSGQIPGGGGLVDNGLTITTGGSSTIEGLSVVDFGMAGIDLAGPGGQNIIQNNYVGVMPDGLTTAGNLNGIVVNSSDNNIGGSSGNRITASTNAGVLLSGPGATGNLVIGNGFGSVYGTDVNTGSNKVSVDLAASNNTVANNMIAGNPDPMQQTNIGIMLEDSTAGNLIQTNAILNTLYGISFGVPGATVTGTAPQATIGGTAQGGNGISGNGVGITGTTAGSLIAGNTIGGPSTPNGDGILLNASNTTIGGTTSTAGNKVVDNAPLDGFAGTGIDLTGFGDLLEGNGLSYNVVGLALHVNTSTIGGTIAGASNLISDNSSDGITLDDEFGNQILGNVIGQASLNSGGRNGGNGISITIPAGSAFPYALDDTIGGTVAGAGNTISGNGGSGILVNGNKPSVETGLSIRGNSIDNNDVIAINLDGTGQQKPSYLFLNGENFAGGNVTLSGVYFDRPSKSFSIDLFVNVNLAPGFGQGEHYLGTEEVTTDNAGFATFTATFPLPSDSSIITMVGQPPALPNSSDTSFSATVTAQDGSTSEFSPNFPGSGTASTTPTADLVVTTQASSPTFQVGGSTTITDTVTNDGPDTAENVQLYDTLPAGLGASANVSTNVGTAMVDNGQTNILSGYVNSLAPGQSFVVTFTASTSQAGTFVDTPAASSTTLDPDYSNNFAQQTLNSVTGSAVLEVSQVASTTSPVVGSNFTYTVTVFNAGPNTANNVALYDFLPSNVTFVSATATQGGQPYLSQTLVNATDLRSIAPGASATLTIVVTATTPGSIINTANVTSDQYNPDSSSAGSTLETKIITPAQSIDLVLSQTVVSPTAEVGQYEVFTMTVTNYGPDAATNATLIDSLPTNATFIDAAPSQGGYASLANGVITDDFGTIAAGASATLTVILIPKTPGVDLNFAGVYTPDIPLAPPSFSTASVAVPSGPSVVSVEGQGKNSSLVISFDQPLTASSATNKANYKLIALGRTRKDHPKTVPITSLTYNSTTHQVTIKLIKPLDPTQYYQLVVVGSTSEGITDVFGHHLVNPQYSTPGANSTTSFFAGTLAQVTNLPPI